MPELKEQKEFSRKLCNLAVGGVVTLSCLSTLHLFRNINAAAATATLPVIAKLIRAIEITVDTSLNFGTMAMTIERAGIAHIDPGLNRLIVDSSSSFSMAGGTPQAGRLTIKGAAFPVSVSLENSVIDLTNGVTTVTVGDFNFLTANGGSRVTVTPAFDKPTFTVPVGATLNSKPGQATGTYVGTARIYANFQ